MSKLSRALGVAALVAGASAAAPPLCGNMSVPLNRAVPNVLLIGDSISMVPPYTPGGYGGALRDLLTANGIASQHAGGWYAGGQCSNTPKGLACTLPNETSTNWLGVVGADGKPAMFDICHGNFGLHDLVAACTNGQTGECEEHVDLPVYGDNLFTIFDRLRPVCKKFMWTSTTPCPNVTTSLGRTYDLVVQYNQQAVLALSAAAAPGQLLVHDLWSDFIAHCGAYYTTCDWQLPANVHLTPAGIAGAAASALAAITAALA